MNTPRRRCGLASTKSDDSVASATHHRQNAQAMERDVSKGVASFAYIVWAIGFCVLWTRQLGAGSQCLCLQSRGNTGLRWSHACFIEHQQLFLYIAVYLSTWFILLAYRLLACCSWVWSPMDVMPYRHQSTFLQRITNLWCAPGYADPTRGLFEVRLAFFLLAMLSLSATDQSSLPHVVYAPLLYKRRLEYQSTWPANIMMAGSESDHTFWVSGIEAATLSAWMLAPLLLLIPDKLRQRAGVDGLLKASLHVLCIGYIYLQALIQGLMTFAIEADGRENFITPPRLLGIGAVLDCSHGTVLSATVMLGLELSILNVSSRSAVFLRRWVLVMMGVFYFNSAVAKLVESGWSWARGDILQKLIEAKGDDRLYDFFTAHGVAALFKVLDRQQWYMMLSGGTLSFELCLAPLALLGRRWIAMFCLVVFAFHYSIVWIMGVHFDYHLVFLLLLIPWPQEYGITVKVAARTYREPRSHDTDGCAIGLSRDLVCAIAGFVATACWLAACHNGPLSAQGHRGGDFLWPVTSAPLFAYPPGHKFQGSVFNAIQKS